MTLNKIVIAGGTGCLGESLKKRFADENIEVVILTRKFKKSDKNVRYVQWDAENVDEWGKELESSMAVINLTGKSVNCRYTEENKKEIIESRTLSTLAIGKAIQNCKVAPKVWINAGSAAIFGDSGEAVKIESSAIGKGFSPEVCIQWEEAFNALSTPNTRKVFLRIGMVLQLDGGVLKPFSNLVKFGLGGKIGSGKQYLTWIHEIDFVEMVEWIIHNSEVQGVIHCASPNPVTNFDFMKGIRKVYNMPFGIPTPAFLVRIGAVIIGTEAELALSGRRVVSEVLKQKNYKFKFPEFDEAVADILK